jgi:hypothetical protein
MNRLLAPMTGVVAVTVSVAALLACSAPGSAPPAGSTTSSGGSGSSGGGSGSSSGGSGSSSGTSDTGPATLPFVVSNYFVPSGFMGDSPTDFNGIKMSSDASQCPTRQSGVEGACYSVSWTPTPLSGQKTAWVGVYWQYPSNNWGAKPGKSVAAGATKVTFLAQGAAGGEQIEFLAGGVNTAGGNASLTYADTFTATTNVTLTNTWAPYEVDLTGDSYSSVIGGFAWTITTSSTAPITFYVDDIVWE